MSADGQETTLRLRRFALNAFIATHLVILCLWSLPTTPFRNAVVKPVTLYVNYTGLWHNWNMFAPTPLKTHFDVRAKIKYQDGSEAEWIAPRLEELPVWERGPMERHRKWREKIRTDEFSRIWNETAHFIAREMNRRPQNPPVEVKLSRHWVDLPTPVRGDYQPMPKSYTATRSYVFATVPIRHQDL